MVSRCFNMTYYYCYPFGMEMVGRSGNVGEYRYGYQGSEKDDEIKGEGNTSSYKYRMSDNRLGRFFATDPLESKYPYYSPYQFSGNRVLDAIELEGLEPWLLKNKAKDVASLSEFREFAKTQFEVLTSEDCKYKSDCANFVLYVYLKYAQYKGIDVGVVGYDGVKRSASDEKYKNYLTDFGEEEAFERFYNDLKYRVGAADIYDDVNTYVLDDSERKYGDILVNSTHAMYFVSEDKRINVVQSTGKELRDTEHENYSVSKPYYQSWQTDYVNYYFYSKQWNMFENTDLRKQEVSYERFESLPAKQIPNELNNELALPNQ